MCSVSVFSLYNVQGSAGDGWHHIVDEIVFYLRTSAVSSTNFGSILIFASCVVGINILCG